MSPSDHASDVTMTEIVLPQHTNALGSVFGGVVMSWMDIAAACAAMRHARKIVVTASVDALHFLAPVRLGWIVTIRARINHTWTSSMEVGVRIEAENPLTGEHFHTASAYVTFVALSDTGQPTPIDPIQAKTEDDLRRQRQAMARRQSRLDLKQKLAEKP